MPHLKMWEIMDRATDGPFVEDDDFLYKIFLPKMKQVIRKYGIKFDPNCPVPADDDLADRIWHAAVEFFLAVGVHNVDHAPPHPYQRTGVERSAVPGA